MQFGRTRLHYANNVEMAKALLDGKADINAKDNKVMRMHKAGRDMHR